MPQLASLETGRRGGFRAETEQQAGSAQVPCRPGRGRPTPADEDDEPAREPFAWQAGHGGSRRDDRATGKDKDGAHLAPQLVPTKPIAISATCGAERV